MSKVEIIGIKDALANGATSDEILAQVKQELENAEKNNAEKIANLNEKRFALSDALAKYICTVSPKLFEMLVSDKDDPKKSDTSFLKHEFYDILEDMEKNLDKAVIFFESIIDSVKEDEATEEKDEDEPDWFDDVLDILKSL